MNSEQFPNVSSLLLRRIPFLETIDENLTIDLTNLHCDEELEPLTQEDIPTNYQTFDPLDPSDPSDPSEPSETSTIDACYETHYIMDDLYDSFCIGNSSNKRIRLS